MRQCACALDFDRSRAALYPSAQSQPGAQPPPGGATAPDQGNRLVRAEPALAPLSISARPRQEATKGDHGDRTRTGGLSVGALPRVADAREHPATGRSEERRVGKE